MLTRWLARKFADRSDNQLERENARLREELEVERVKGRVQQAEIELLAAVHARNLSRWQAELPSKDDE